MKKQKKLFSIMTVLILFFGSVFYFFDGEFDFSWTDSSKVSEFVLFNNLDDTKSVSFDKVYKQVSKIVLTTFPFKEDITEVLKQCGSVIDVIPNYKMMILPKKGQLNLEFSIEADGQKKNIDTGPYVREYDGYVYAAHYYVQNYPNKDNVSRAIQKIKTFDSESGVYISEDMYEHMNLSDNCKRLVVNIDISVPHYVEKKITTYPDKVCCTPSDPCEYLEYPSYEVVEYTTETVSLEVEGVYKVPSNGSEGYQICLSSQLAKEIYQRACENREDDPSKQLWEPNSYWITTSKDVKLEPLGQEINQYLSEFILCEHKRSEYEDFRMIFK